MDGSQLFPPFTIHEAEFAMYLADRDLALEPLGPVFMGGRLEDLAPELSFSKMPLSRQGDPLGTIFHADEEHRFTIGNLWVLERGSNFLPRPLRNQQYIFVIRWLDPETQVWAKRTYYGVTADGQSLAVADQAFHQKIGFTARYLDEGAGSASPPDLSPSLTLALRYVTARERTDLYFYNPDDGTFSLARAGITDARAMIVLGGSSWALQFHGADGPAFRLTAGGAETTEAGGLSAIGGTFPLRAIYPRVEFWIGPSGLGSITADGEFAAASLHVSDSEPALEGRFFRIEIDGNWVFSLGRGGAWAPSFSETM